MGNLQVSCCAAQRPKLEPKTDPKLKVIVAYDREGQMKLHFQAEDANTGEPIPVITSEIDERHQTVISDGHQQQQLQYDGGHKRGPSGRIVFNTSPKKPDSMDRETPVLQPKKLEFQIPEYQPLFDRIDSFQAIHAEEDSPKQW